MTKKIVELMSASTLKQPTDDITGAWPMLWRLNIRPLAEWYNLQSPSAPASYRQPVAVAPEVRDAPKPSVVVTESAVSVTIVSPASGTSFAPAPDASESPVIDDTVQIPVSVPALPEGEESTSTPEIPAVDCLPPNPFTGFVPVPKRVIELGHGHPPRYEMWRIGNALSCEICGVSGSRKELELHRQSEGHVFERENSSGIDRVVQ